MKAKAHAKRTRGKVRRKGIRGRKLRTKAAATHSAVKAGRRRKFVCGGSGWPNQKPADHNRKIAVRHPAHAPAPKHPQGRR